MLAVRLHDFGDADRLNIEEVPMPAPREGEVLVRVRASSINAADIRVRRGKDRTLGSGALPLTPGYDVAGEVIGDYADKQFEPGARVFALCGPRAGAHAEVVSLRPAQIAYAPKRVSLQMAGVVPLAGLTALQGLRDHARVGAAARVLVVGAASGVGSFAVQIAHALGAHVTGICTPAQRDFVSGLGAEKVLDINVPGKSAGRAWFSRAEPAAQPRANGLDTRHLTTDALRDGEPWDVIFDAEGLVRFRAARAVLAPRGTLVTARASRSGSLLNAISRVNRGLRFRAFAVRSTAADLATLASWIDARMLRAPIHLNFAMTEIRDAHRCFEQGAVNGKLSVGV